jgi:VanZ family protein
MTPRSLLAWSWTFVIMALCWIPRFYFPDDERLPKPFFVPNFDKLVHMGIFAVFAVLWMRAGQAKHRARWVFLAGLALATITELGQMVRFVNRDANVADGFADMMGVVVGLVACLLVYGTPDLTPRSKDSDQASGPA